MKDRSILKLLLGILIFLIVSSCATSSKPDLEPQFGRFHIPAITLQEPIEDLGFRIPLTAARINKKKKWGVVVVSKNIKGFEAFKAVAIKASKIKKGYAYITSDDNYKFHAGDQLIDHIPLSLQKLNESRHEWLIECFQRGHSIK